MGEDEETNWASLAVHEEHPGASASVSLVRGPPKDAAPPKASLSAAVAQCWGSIDSSGYKEPQQQCRRGLGQGNGWEKPVH